MRKIYADRAELYRARRKALIAAGGKKIIVELSPESNAVLQMRVAETGQTQTAVINGLLSG